MEVSLHSWSHDATHGRGLSRVDTFRIVQLRAKDAGLLGEICNHSFGATGLQSI